MLPIQVFNIPWRIPSKKNSKRIIVRGKRGLLLPSEKYIEWENSIIKRLLFTARKMKLWWNLHFMYHFHFPDNRKTDMSNKIESINDMLVKAWYIEDDNATIISRITSLYWWVDKDRAWCVVEIFKL